METVPTMQLRQQKNLTLSLSGLSDLGADFVYETWIIVNVAPVSIGTFTIDGAGTISTSTFTE